MTEKLNTILHPFPCKVEDVTADWLTAALQRHYPGALVKSFHFGEINWGTATKMRLMLDYNRRGHELELPATMYLKGGVSVQHQHEVVASGYEQEVRFFRDIAPALSIPLPACYFSDTDGATGQALVLMEDLLARNAGFGHALSPIGPDTVALGLELLAGLHAHWWQAPQLVDLDRFPGVLADINLSLLTPDYFADCLARPRASEVPAELRDLNRVREAQQALWNLGVSSPCLIHGDPHLGNWYFESNGEPRLLDWQGIMCGNWAHDVAYFVIGSMTMEDRRLHQRELLRHYLAHLAEQGVSAPGFDEAWLAYRQYAMHGFMWLLNPVELQPEDITQACAVRFSIAVDELDTLGALNLR